MWLLDLRHTIQLLIVHLINEGRRKGRLDIYVNGYLKFTKEDFDEFLFKDLNEHREKQQGVPFNYSFWWWYARFNRNKNNKRS